MCKNATRFVWLVWGVLLAACGCAAGGYQGSYYYPEPPYVYSEPGYGRDVPPSFYNYDPSLRQWYSPPYWNPETP